MDRGNRAFWALVGVVVGFRGVLMLLACCVVCVVAVQLFTGGLAVLWATGMLPAVALAVLLVATTIAAGTRFAAQMRADRCLRREISARAVASGPYVGELAADFGLTDRVTVADAGEPFAFTYGLLVPRVAVSRALVDSLARDELAAVLAHEAAHVRSRDPLKVLLTRVLVAREFYLPALRHLSHRFVAGRELAADRQAVSRCGTGSVAAALLRTAAPPAWAATTPAAAMASGATLHARVTQLETGSEPLAPPLPQRLLVASTVAAMLVMATAADAAAVVQQLCMQGM